MRDKLEEAIYVSETKRNTLKYKRCTYSYLQAGETAASDMGGVRLRLQRRLFDIRSWHCNTDRLIAGPSRSSRSFISNLQQYTDWYEPTCVFKIRMYNKSDFGNCLSLWCCLKHKILQSIIHFDPTLQGAYNNRSDTCTTLPFSREHLQIDTFILFNTRSVSAICKRNKTY